LNAFLDFRRELRYIKDICILTYTEKPIECRDLFNTFSRLCLLADIGEDIYRSDNYLLPYYLGSLSVRSFLEFQATLLEGAYFSAGRTLRWLYETNVAGASACENPFLLDREYEGLDRIDLEKM
jgi:hypothetical protein